jgi:hypothetical protein
MDGPCVALGVQGSDETVEAHAEARYRHRVGGSEGGCVMVPLVWILTCKKHMTIIRIDDFSSSMQAVAGLCNFL